MAVLAWSIQHKKGLTAEWVSEDDTLLEGQIGLEMIGSNFTKMKIGNGVDPYSALPYFTPGGSVNSINGTANRISVDNTDPANPIIDIDPAFLAYVESLVVGLWDDRGSYAPGSNVFPSSGGSGPGGTILKGDIYTIFGSATLGGHDVNTGDTIRALVDNPGQTDAYWAILENNIGYVPENQANKDTANGYPGLSAWKIKFRNLANTFTSFLTNANTAARTYLFKDRDGTIADEQFVLDELSSVIRDQGNYDASSNLFPTAGGSGPGGAIAKGDQFTISVNGTLGGTPVVAPYDIIRARADAPGQTAASWYIGHYAAPAPTQKAFVLPWGITSQFNPADNTIYYIGMPSLTPLADSKDKSITMPVSGTCVAATITTIINNALGTSEPVTFKMRVRAGGINGVATDYTITTSKTINSTYQNSIYTGLNIPYNAGDQIEIFMVSPTWVTNPGGIFIYITTYHTA